MSSFIKEATNPKTGKKQKAFFIDDNLLRGYRIGFRKDGKDVGYNAIHFKELDWYREDEVK